MSLRVRSSLRNEIRDAVEAERVLRVIPKIGQTCPELRTVFALSLCFVSLSGERNEKESLLMVRRGRGWLSLAAQLQKNFWFFFKKEQPYLLSYFQKPFPNRENLDSAMLVTHRFFLIVSQNQPSFTRQTMRQFL